MFEYDAKRWTSHLFDIRHSSFGTIILRVGACVGWSLVVLLVHDVVAARYQKDPLTIPTTMHTLVGFALGTLLVFRINTAYDRFWEGRKLWGGIVNESRNLARLVVSHLASDEELMASTLRWTMAWPHAAMHGLRGGIGLGPAAAMLPPTEVQEAEQANHVALHVANQITAHLVLARTRGLVSDVTLSHLDNNVQALIDYLGACERIKKTPLPFAYMVHIRRVLLLYCFTLPFALVNDFGAGAIVATLLVAYIFFGIEEISVEIENPFDGDVNDLPLERICATIDNNLTALLPPRTREVAGITPVDRLPQDEEVDLPVGAGVG